MIRCRSRSSAAAPSSVDTKAASSRMSSSPRFCCSASRTLSSQRASSRSHSNACEATVIVFSSGIALAMRPPFVSARRKLDASARSPGNSRAQRSAATQSTASARASSTFEIACCRRSTARRRAFSASLASLPRCRSTNTAFSANTWPTAVVSASYSARRSAIRCSTAGTVAAGRSPCGSATQRASLVILVPRLDELLLGRGDLNGRVRLPLLEPRHLAVERADLLPPVAPRTQPTLCLLLLAAPNSAELLSR